MKSERKRIIGLIVIMALTTVFMTGVTIRILYRIAFNEQRERLVEICHFSGRLIEAMARFNRQYNAENLRAIVLQQVLDAQQHYRLQDRALEIALAYRDGETIQYVFRLKQGDNLEYPPAIPWSSHLSQAMHLALSGKSGTNISLNAGGKVVLAAYEPVPELDLGIVAKLEVAHFRAPYIAASIAIGLLTTVFVAIGAFLFVRISEPIIRRLSERTDDLEQFNAQLQQEITERKRAEATLQESEERFRQLAENIHEVFWMTDPKTEEVLYVSPAYEQVWGRSCASLYAHPVSFQASILPGDLQYSDTTLAQTAQGESVNVQYRIVRPDGGIRWIWSRGFPIRDEQGEVYRIAGISEDITERKQAEEALRRREHDFSTLIEHTPDMIVRFDTQLRHVYCNPAVEKQLGVTLSAILGKTPTEIGGPPEQVAFIESTLRHVLESKQEMDVEQAYPTPFGQKHFLTRIVPEYDETGHTISLLAITRDITDRKLTEEALRDSEEKFRALVQNAPARIAAVDRNGILLFINYTVQERPLEEVIGTSVYQHLPSDVHEQTRQALATVFDTGGIAKYEMKIARPDGTSVWYANQVAPLRQGEQITAALYIATDITALKDAQERLQQAKEMADSANRAKSEFLAHINHELRTPLNGILGYTQILQRDQSFPSAYLPQIAMIHRSGEHLLDLINEMLDLAKIEAGRVELFKEEFHLGYTLTTLVEMIRVRAQQKDLQFLDECAADLPSIIVGDVRRLRQVLLNLLGNAIKFTEQGRVTLRVVRVPFDAPDNEMTLTKLRFSVKDTGIGIPEEKQQEIFQPFRQIGNSTYQNQGTGLGLTISMRLVKLMGGEIRVENLPEGGSHFWFEAVFPEIRAAQPELSQHAPRILGLPEGTHYRILIVDDHQEDRKMLSAMLAPLGFTLIEAANGVEALHAYEMSRPDAILMDMAMPEMDGVEATQRIRRHEQTAIQNAAQLTPIPIIAVSADVYDQHRGLEAGCQNFLAKPVRFDALCACLQTHLQIAWRYDAEERRLSPSVSKERPLILPPFASLQRLYEAALIGDVMEVRAQLKALEQSDSRYETFTKRLREWLALFQFHQIRACLENAMAEAADGRMNSFPHGEKMSEFPENM